MVDHQRSDPIWYMEIFQNISSHHMELWEMRTQNNYPMFPVVESCFKDFMWIMVKIGDEWQRPDEPLNENVELLLQSLAKAKALDYYNALREAWPSWQREINYYFSGKKRGYVSDDRTNWTAMLDERALWMERRENGKGWKVSASQIQTVVDKHYPDLVISTTTINRERRKRLKT